MRVSDRRNVYDLRCITLTFEKKNTVSLNVTGCSGNGKPVTLRRCGARCQCLGGWEGEYCDRISGNGGGDPHLKTLDGKKQQGFV